MNEWMKEGMKKDECLIYSVDTQFTDEMATTTIWGRGAFWFSLSLSLSLSLSQFHTLSFFLSIYLSVCLFLSLSKSLFVLGFH